MEDARNRNSMSINCSFLFYVMQYCIYAKDNNTMRTVLVLFCIIMFCFNNNEIKIYGLQRFVYCIWSWHVATR